MAAAAAAEAAAADAVANSQDAAKAADIARRSAAGAFAGRVAGMRAERVRGLLRASGVGWNALLLLMAVTHRVCCSLPTNKYDADIKPQLPHGSVA